jgi:hypothetical protein
VFEAALNSSPLLLFVLGLGGDDSWTENEPSHKIPEFSVPRVGANTFP